MGGARHKKGKGLGKGKGKSGGKDHGKGKAGSKGAVVTWEIKESRVDLGEEGRDEVLGFIRHLSRARGDAAPVAHSEAHRHEVDFASLAANLGQEDDDFAGLPAGSGSSDGGENEASELDEAWVGDDAEAGDHASERENVGDVVNSGDDASEPDEVGDIVPWGYGEDEDGGCENLEHREKHERRRLLQHLILEDRRSEARGEEDDEPACNRTVSSGAMPGHTVGAMVNVLVCDASQMHLKPKGPVSVPRGEAGAVDMLLRKARVRMGIKGRKALTAYTVGANARVTGKLLRTSDLADGQLVAISSKELCLPVRPADAQAPVPRPEEVVESTAALHAVRAAYKKNAESDLSAVGILGRAAAENVRDMSAELFQHAQAYASDGKFGPMRELRAALPAARVREELAAALELSQVVIVVGETGSGKTTQCPNFILEAASQACRGGDVTIICTQPRRIAAVSVAERVAQERGERTGEAVGYAVRLESRASKRTRLLFCTTGVLLQKLNSSPDLDGVTHVVVDEAHERNLHTDFLLMLLREVLERRADLRVVVMSATLEQGLFASYFQGFAFDPSDDLPVVRIEGRTYPLMVRYVGEARALAGAAGGGERRAAATEEEGAVDVELEAWIRRAHPSVGDAEASREVLISPAVKGKPDYSLIADLCSTILQGHVGPSGADGVDDGAILVFLPGYVEIQRCMRALKTHRGVGERAWLLPLHGSMPIGEQQRVFRRPPQGTRKIIVATNIAETSVTIDDVTHVIDSGHVRETRYSPQSSMSVFSTVWVSAAAARQRAGRASRTRPGVCWRLYEESFLETKLPKHTLCEMRRTALEELVLQLRLLELGVMPGEFLQKAPEPPSPEAVAAAVASLISIGALVNSPNLPLTALGFHLAHMPMDARVGKMLVYGALCCCLAPMLTIAACLAHRSPFARSFNPAKEIQQRKARAARFGHLCSDHLAAAAVYDAYLTAKATEDGGAAASQLCDELGLSSSVLDGMTQLRGRFLRHLAGIGFADSLDEDGGAAVNTHKDNLSLVRCMLCAGLFPNVVQVQRHGKTRGPKVVLVSRECERCAVHPSSINAHQQDEFAANSSWLLFHTKVKTSQIFVQDSTLVGSVPLLLFGGELKLNRARTHIMVSGLLFKVKKEATAVLFKLLRKEADRLLLLKVSDPKADLAEMVNLFLACVTRLLKLGGSSVSGLYGS